MYYILVQDILCQSMKTIIYRVSLILLPHTFGIESYKNKNP